MTGKTTSAAVVQLTYEPDTQRMLTVDEWDRATFPAASSGRLIYLPVRAVSRYLGVNSNGQLAMLQRDKLLTQYLRSFFIKGRGGRQASWCLDLRAVALWFVKLNAEFVRPELQAGLLDWQERILQEAHRLFWGQGQEPVESQVNATDLRTIEDLQLQVELQKLEIRELRLKLRLQGRRLSLVERTVLADGVYFDIDGVDD